MILQDLERKQQALIDHLEESKLTIEALTGRYELLDIGGERRTFWQNITPVYFSFDTASML